MVITEIKSTVISRRVLTALNYPFSYDDPFIFICMSDRSWDKFNNLLDKGKY